MHFHTFLLPYDGADHFSNNCKPFAQLVFIILGKEASIVMSGYVHQLSEPITILSHFSPSIFSPDRDEHFCEFLLICLSYVNLLWLAYQECSGCKLDDYGITETSYIPALYI